MKPITWSTEKRKVKDLIPNKRNPRKMSKEQAEQLIKSLERFDYVELIVIQPDNRVIAGHMRIKALKELNRADEEIEVRLPSRFLTEREEEEYLIRSNKNIGEWDWDELASSWDAHDLIEWGFTEKEITDNFLDESVISEKDDIKATCTFCGHKINPKKIKQ